MALESGSERYAGLWEPRSTSDESSNSESRCIGITVQHMKPFPTDTPPRGRSRSGILILGIKQRV